MSSVFIVKNAEMIYSVWSTEELADKEVKRIWECLEDDHFFADQTPLAIDVEEMELDVANVF